MKVTGRNYGRDLACKFLIKKYAGVHLNVMVNDALQQTDSEITGVGWLTPVPVVDAEFNKTYLQNGFVEAFAKIGWDFTVTNEKQFKMWSLTPTGRPATTIPDTGITLKSVPNDPSNNILLINSETRDGYRHPQLHPS